MSFPRCPKGTEVHSFLFPAKEWTTKRALSFARKHGYSRPRLVGKDSHFLHVKVAPHGGRVVGAKMIGRGIRILLLCPSGVKKNPSSCPAPNPGTRARRGKGPVWTFGEVLWIVYKRPGAGYLKHRFRGRKPIARYYPRSKRAVLFPVKAGLLSRNGG